MCLCLLRSPPARARRSTAEDQVLSGTDRRELVEYSCGRLRSAFNQPWQLRYVSPSARYNTRKQRTLKVLLIPYHTNQAQPESNVVQQVQSGLPHPPPQHMGSRFAKVDLPSKRVVQRDRCSLAFASSFGPCTTTPA